MEELQSQGYPAIALGSCVAVTERGDAGEAPMFVRRGWRGGEKSVCLEGGGERREGGEGCTY